MDTNEILADWDFNLHLANLFARTINPLELQEIGYSWIKRIQSLDESDFRVLRAHILKLLLLSLQNNRLVGPFKRIPPRTEEKLEQMFCGYRSSQITNEIMKEQFGELLTTEPIPPLPVSTGCYTILQVIPEYGGHFYDSNSSEAIKNVNHLKTKELPVGAMYIFPAYCTKQLYYTNKDKNVGLIKTFSAIVQNRYP